MGTTNNSKSFYYGWVVMLSCAVSTALISTVGMQATQFSNGLMRQDTSVTLSATTYGLGYTVFALMQGIPGLFLGKHIIKRGAKSVYLMGGITAVITGLLFGNLIDKSPFFFILGYGFFFGFAGFCASQLAAQTLVNTWFVKKRGSGSAMRTVSAAIIGFFTPHIIRWATSLSGGNWRYGWYIMAIGGAISIVVTLLFMKNKPSDVGQCPDNLDPMLDILEKGNNISKYSNVYKRPNGEDIKYNEAIRSYSLWAIIIMCMGGFCVSNLLYSPGSLYFMGIGLTTENLATAQSFQVISSLLGALIINRLSDRIEPLYLVAGCVGFMCLGALGATKASVETPVLMYLFYISAAIGMVGTMQVVAIGIGNLFGNAEFPRIQGLCLFVAALVSSQVSTIAGIVFDRVGSYVPVFYIFAIFGLISIIPTLFIKIPKIKVKDNN